MKQRKLRHAIKKLPSGRYQITFRDADKVKHRESYDRERDAIAALDERRAQVRRREYIAPVNVPTFAAAAEDWLQMKKTTESNRGGPRKAATVDGWKKQIDKYFMPTWGKLKLDQIKTSDIESRDLPEWESKNKKKLCGKTLNAILTTASSIFDNAIRLGQIRFNPVEHVKRRSTGSVEVKDGEVQRSGVEVTEEMVYTPDDLGSLIESTAPGFPKAIIMTVGLTGIRHGEALGLKWNDVNLVSGKITIRRAWEDEWDGDRPVFTTPKTKAGLREIDIAPELVSCLRRWKLQCPKSEFGLVFPQATGWPQSRKAVLRDCLYPAIKKAGIKKLDMQALRHTYASILLSQGAAITEVAAILGHSNPHVTLTVYSHWLPRQKTGTAAKAAAAILDGKKAVEEPLGHLMATWNEKSDPEMAEVAISG